MADTSGIYTILKTDMMTKLCNLGADTFLVALYDGTFSFDATATTYSTTKELATSNGYTQGGASFPSPTVGAGTPATKIKWTAGGSGITQWTSSGAGFTASFAVIYDTSNSNHLVCCLDFSSGNGGPKTASGGGTFTITWAAGGVITLS